MELFIDIWWIITCTVFAIGVMDCFFLLMAVAVRGGESVAINVSTALLDACESAVLPSFFNQWIYPQDEWSRMFAISLVTMLLGGIWLGPLAIVGLGVFWVKRWFYLRDVMEMFGGRRT